MAKRSRTLRYKVLMIGVLVVVVGWTVGWFMIATVVDRHAENAAQEARKSGSVMDCVNRSVSGFPFRIEVRCGNGSRIGNGEGMVTLNSLTAAALIYKPSRLIVEARSPATVRAAGLPPLAADWSLAHASARLDLEKQALQRFDVEVKAGVLTLGEGEPVPFDELHVNVRETPSGDGKLDVALRLVDVVPPGVEAPISLVLRGQVEDGALLLERPDAALEMLADGGLVVLIDTASVASADNVVAASGKLTLEADGRLNGSIDLAVAGDDLPLLEAFAPPQTRRMVNTVISNVLSFAPATTIGDKDARKLTLTVRDNKVAAGVIPLVELPRIDLRQMPPIPDTRSATVRPADSGR